MSINTPKKANFCTSNKTCAMQNTNMQQELDTLDKCVRFE